MEEFDAVIENEEVKFNEDQGYQYNFETSNNIKQRQEGDGESIVEGEYSYVDPDGRLVRVTYTAGAGIGFNPKSEIIDPAIQEGVELVLKNPPLPPDENLRK